MGSGTPKPEQTGAFAHQLRQFRPSLVGWFRRRVGDMTDAEDLAQECFLRFANRQAGDEVANVEAYLYQTARAVLFDRQRRRNVRHAGAHLPLLPEHGEADDVDALRALIARERLQQVSATLLEMPERTRAIFVLSRLEGMRYAEIATRFDISVSAVQKHMLRAIETLLRARAEER
ncbi:sigma-70 family RNA polymerase sigma factor [Sphingomonas sp.]|uniref:RNA polymerase sigma factor n=1 Tax=Sphingomonas sp. TaxID=28214 RepID=UPI001B048C17|nr:sigma-70 family RNA polymerase sigma factor [Sphingomonas sp.]MBO9711644.1 sigma-70 family RNA polymerase sigma factor [Sphingomonas sp.]